RGSLLGSVAILLPQGVILRDKDMIKTLILQSSIALQRRQESITVRESEQRFRKITELSPFPIAISTTAGRYLYLNPRFMETFGYTLEDLRTTKDWFRLAFPDMDQRKNAISGWNDDIGVREPGKVRSRIFPVSCKDGTVKEVVFRTVSQSDMDQFTVFEDVTQERRAEEVRVLLASIVQSCDDAIIGKKVDGTVITWNPAAERIYGYTADEMIGRSISVVVPPDRKEDLKTILSEIEMGKHIQHFETKRVRKDGTLFDASITASPIVDQNGDVIGISSIVRDITPVKAEERLKEGEDKYRALVEDLDIGVYRSTGDPLGRFVWGNSNLVRILGYSSFEDLQEVAVSDLFLQQQGRKRLLDELREKGFVKDREIFLKKKDGSPLAVSVTALARFSPVGDILCVTGIVVDISDRKHAEQEFAEARQQMSQITELLPDPAMITDRGGHVIAWNRAMERFTGVKKTEIIGKDGYSKAFSGMYGDRPILIDLLDTADAETRFPGITRFGENLVRKLQVHEAGSDREISVVEKASALYNENGARIGGFLSIHDADEWESIVASLHTERQSG
ncbi:MAG: PAS domain S-box protein, partial [Methanoregulaceae archaeon]|nr:PAS domain S-box protein [Methanoregulaceae archaeon]